MRDCIPSPLWALALALTVVACSDGRKAWSSGAQLPALQEARLSYRARDYSNAYVLLGKLANGGLATGDVFFYLAKSLDEVEGSTNASPDVIGYYERATNWFREWKSEFPEDANREKAYYNLGIMYYRRGPSQDLRRTKAIWDEARRVGADGVLKRQKQGSKSQYEILRFQLPLFDAEMAARQLRERLRDARTATELADIDGDYKRLLKPFDIKPFLNREDTQIQPSDLLLHLLRRWDTVLDERRQELGLH